jgi:hypothetical protein
MKSAIARGVSGVGSWQEVPIAASDGRLQVQNGLWRGIHGRIYEFMA